MGAQEAEKGTYDAAFTALRHKPPFSDGRVVMGIIPFIRKELSTFLTGLLL